MKIQPGTKQKWNIVDKCFPTCIIVGPRIGKGLRAFPHSAKREVIENARSKKPRAFSSFSYQNLTVSLYELSHMIPRSVLYRRDCIDDNTKRCLFELKYWPGWLLIFYNYKDDVAIMRHRNRNFTIRAYENPFWEQANNRVRICSNWASRDGKVATLRAYRESVGHRRDFLKAPCEGSIFKWGVLCGSRAYYNFVQSHHTFLPFAGFKHS